MKQASTVKKSSVKTPSPASIVAPTATKSKVETSSTKTACSKEDFHKKVAEKAYELFLQRKGAQGSAEEDWAKAEKIVKGL